MKQTLTIPETFLGVGYTKDRAGLPRESVRVPVPRPRADQVLIRVAASSLNPLEYKLAELNFLGRTPPVILGLDLSGLVVATGSAVRGVAVGDAVVAMADLNGDGGWGAGGGGEGGYALARAFLTVPKPECLSFLSAAALPMCFLSAFATLYRTLQAADSVSPVDSILAERGAKHININILRYFSEPATLDDEAKAFLQRGMTLAMEWAVQGLVIPHVGRTIDSTVEAINAGLRSLKAGTGTLGKVAVIVDRDLVEGS